MFESWNSLRRRIRTWNGTPATRRRPRGLAPQLDGLEGRVVLSRIGLGGQGLAARAAANRLAPAAVASLRSARLAPATATPTTTPCAGRHGGPGAVQDAQFQADMETLRADTQAVLAGSTVTDAQRLALGDDLRAIARAGFEIDRTAFGAVADSLLTALADGTYDSDPTVAAAIEQSFKDLFTGSSVEGTLVQTTYDDFVAVARGLNVSTDELSKLAADRAAIQADLTRLGLDTTATGHGPGQGTNLELILGRGPGRGPGGPGGHRGGRGR
jgi:hypothetical protein